MHALEKRTCGDFLDAGPASRGRRCASEIGQEKFSEFEVQLDGSQGTVETLKRWSTLETLPPDLLADAEFGNDGLVALGIVFLEVVEQATPLADQHEKAAARAVVLLVRLEVLRQLANAFTDAWRSEPRDSRYQLACVRTGQ